MPGRPFTPGFRRKTPPASGWAARCASCHSGRFQTDHRFHAIGVPQIGPGKGDNAPGYDDGRDDFGRESVTGDPDDRYKFRTPTLRNVALTGPWGHCGSYRELERMVRHHLDAINVLRTYDSCEAILPSRPDLDAVDVVVIEDPSRMAEIAARIEIAPVDLDDRQIGYLMDFLDALTDPASVDIRLDQPMELPSGLPPAD